MRDQAASVIDRLVQARKAKGFNQRAMARKMGVVPSAVSKFEHLETMPQLDTVLRYANVVGVDLLSCQEDFCTSRANAMLRAGIHSWNGERRRWEELCSHLQGQLNDNRSALAGVLTLCANADEGMVSVEALYRELAKLRQ